jgi:hypothetical protein
MGCAAVVERSTWGQFAKTGSGFTQGDIAAIAAAMTEFVSSSLDRLSVLDVSLSGDCYMIGHVFRPYDFAKQFSQDMLAESTHLSVAAIAGREATDIENQATAALLFRYRYCFLAGEFFDVGTISQWVRLMSTKSSVAVGAAMIVRLLDLLEATTEAGA